jgi:hypothetical protein
MHASTPPLPFKDGGADEDSQKSSHSAALKCLFIVNRSCIHTGVKTFPQVNMKRSEIR